MEPFEISRARAAYNAYNAGGDPATANKNFRGEPCPEWDDLPQNIRDKWVAATAASGDAVTVFADNCLFVAQSFEPGIASQGQTVQEALRNLADALDMLHGVPEKPAATPPSNNIEAKSVGYITAIRAGTFELSLDAGGRVDVAIGMMDPAVLVGLLEMPCDVAITMRPRKKYIDNGRAVWLPEPLDAP